MTWIRTLPAGRAHNHPEPISGAPYSAVELMPNNAHLMVLDQRKLPSQERYEYLKEWTQVEEAIRTMMVRGAPAIGIAAAYGLVLAASHGPEVMRAAADALGKTRPTAVNLAHGIAVMMRAAESERDYMKLAQVARAYHKADVEACKRIGALGAAELPQTSTILTHCNAGALATGGYGTALGVIRAAREAGKAVNVVACETRPLLQGARLTAWELAREHFPATLITDSMAASLMAAGEITAVVVGADRIARNGDVANKVGTYALACLAQAHGIPFYVAAPWSSVDLACESGAAIPIEQRAEEEVVMWPGSEARVAPPGVTVRNPAFDVTPARLISAIFTERGKSAPSALQ